jgi:prepilin-type N-terminal cleavage/methylation domain-containing protein
MRRLDPKGFTLIEILVVVAISAIACTLAMSAWFSNHVSVLERQQRNIDALGLQSACMALDFRFSKAVRFLEIRENRIIWQQSNGRLDTLCLDGNNLLLNGLPFISSKVTSLTIIATGYSWPADSTDKFAHWIQLDMNRDHILDQVELDVDYSRSLDIEEISRVALLELQIVFDNGVQTRIRHAIR